MIDLSQTIIAKSDQLNADDLMPGGRLGGPITVQITRVQKNNDKEQPISVHYDGDQGRPYKPGLSMRRVLVRLWGKDGNNYVGKWLTLFCDPNVTFGKIKVGGIRISHMSHIDGNAEMALQATKGVKKNYVVKELRPPENAGRGQGQGGGERQQDRQRALREEQVDAYIAAIRNPEIVQTVDELRDYQLDERRAQWLAGMRDAYPDLHNRLIEANSQRLDELADAGDGGDPAQDSSDDDSAPGDLP